MLLCNVYVLYSSMEERHLDEWGSLKSNQIKNQIVTHFVVWLLALTEKVWIVEMQLIPDH